MSRGYAGRGPPNAHRYDITSEEDKREALEKTQAHNTAQVALGTKVARPVQPGVQVKRPAQFPHKLLKGAAIWPSRGAAGPFLSTLILWVALKLGSGGWI